MSALDGVVLRLKELLREDAPPVQPDQFYNPEFAKAMADYIGLDESSQRHLAEVGGSGALGLFMYEAFCKAQAELAEDVGNTRTGASASAARKTKESNARAAADISLVDWDVSAALRKDAAYAAAVDKMFGDLASVHEALLALLRKHAKSRPTWSCIAQELEELTGVKKTAGWCEKCARMLLCKLAAASGGAGQSGDAACTDAASEAWAGAELDQLAGELAVKAATDLLTQRFPKLMPHKHAMKMGDSSGAVLWMLRNVDEYREQSQFFRGLAIETVRTEGDAAEALLEVLAYLESHPKSRQALRELQALSCFHVGLQLAGNVHLIADLAMTKTAVELFAWGHLLSDLALSLFANKAGAAASSRFALHEAMQRCSQRVLQSERQDFPALLVKGRLQGGDDHAKLTVQEDCMAALELGTNAEWVVWKARVYEMLGLTYGGLGEHAAAAHAYDLALACSKQRNTMYLRAQVLHALGDALGAHALLNEYFTAVADAAAYDDYLFPNALYLQASVCARQKDLAGMRSYHRSAMAAEEGSRCIFYGAVDCVAKRSTSRMCRVAFGSVKDRQAALEEFSAAFRSHAAPAARGDEPAARHSLSLGEVTSDDFVSETPDKSTSSGSSQIRVHILTLSRHPNSLRDALLLGGSLSACCAALREQGMDPELPGGAKVFCHPDDFEVVVGALAGRDLKPRHVVATSEFLDAVNSAVDSLRSKEQVRRKSDTRIGVSARTCQACGEQNPKYRCQCREAYYCSQQCQKKDYGRHVKTCSAQPASAAVVSRTFIDIKHPGRSNATKSTDRKSVV